MDRRSFLKMLGAAAPVAAISPTYFFAPKGGWHRTYSFKDVTGIFVPDYRLSTAITDDLDSLGRINGICRKPAIRNGNIILLGPETDSQLRQRIIEQINDQSKYGKWV